MVTETRGKIAEDITLFEKEKRSRNTEKKAKFVELFLDRSAQYDVYQDYLQMVKSCYVDAGYSSNDNGVMFNARKVLESVWPEIEEAIHTSLKGGAALAVNTLTHLCANAKQDAVKLKAATELLNKGGFAETQRIAVGNLEELPDAELQKQIKDAMALRGLKVVEA